MTAKILDGKIIASKRQEILRKRLKTFQEKQNYTPCLAVILVGSDPASEIYVNNKIKACAEVGIRSEHFFLPESITQDQLNQLILQLNNDATIDGILVQLPLPAHLKSDEVIELIDPKKDVDALHPLNQGYLFAGTPQLVSCTPLACLHLIKRCAPSIAGKKAVVVGQSILVGRPTSALLLAHHATVTMTHLQTKNLCDETRTADILVAAAGHPHLITANMVKPGAIVIDVGINRTLQSDGSKKIIGDVDFEAVREIASHITPVPGGVGPLTITFLLENTLKIAYHRAGLSYEE